MARVSSPFAEWLRSRERLKLGRNDDALAAWGRLAVDASISSLLAEPAAAEIEADRQIAFFSHPLAVETILVPGRRVDVAGKPYRIVADTEGYRGGAAVFVIAAEERDNGTTLLTVLRRLGDT